MAQLIEYFQGKFVKGRNIVRGASRNVIVMIIKSFSHYSHGYNSLILTTITFYNVICDIMYKSQRFDT